MHTGNCDFNFFKQVWLWVMVMSFLLFSCQMLQAQPYFDIAGLSGWDSPESKSSPGSEEQTGQLFISIPVKVSDRHRIITTMMVESRFISTEKPDDDISLFSASLPLTWYYQFTDSNYSFTVTIIGRMNSTRLGIDEESAQTGGAFVQSVRVSNKVKLKAGLYYNREFFGDFVLPLAGIEWRMNNRMWMYGLLPNSMRMEYKISKELYTGIAFKSITNSFRYKDEPGYFKWQDNHAGIFTDWYLPGKFVLSAEAGHTLFRKLSNRSRDNFHSFKQDGVIFKVGIYYRIRLDG